MARKVLWGSLVLAPITILVDKLTGAGEVTLFVLAALSLVPLAWLIGISTEHAAEHTGPGIGGFLNASFGNAPELIVALFAVGANLPDLLPHHLDGRDRLPGEWGCWWCRPCRKFNSKRCSRKRS